MRRLPSGPLFVALSVLVLAGLYYHPIQKPMAETTTTRRSATLRKYHKAVGPRW